MLLAVASCHAEQGFNLSPELSQREQSFNDSEDDNIAESFQGQGKAILTFDDGPHPKTTLLLLEQLKSAKVKNAIFFLVGERIKKYPNLVKKIDSEGYMIGYHSMNHRNQVGMSPKEINQDIKTFKLLLDETLGVNDSLEDARPPFGGMTTKTAKVFSELEKKGTLHIKDVMSIQFVQKIVADKIIKAYRKNDLKIYLWHIDFNDWKQRIDLKHAKKKFKGNMTQYWLFHEMPKYKKNVFDNHITEDMPNFLKLICNTSNC